MKFAAWGVIGSILLGIRAGDEGLSGKYVYVQYLWSNGEHRKGWHWRQIMGRLDAEWQKQRGIVSGDLDFLNLQRIFNDLL